MICLQAGIVNNNNNNSNNDNDNNNNNIRSHFGSSHFGSSTHSEFSLTLKIKLRDRRQSHTPSSSLKFGLASIRQYLILFVALVPLCTCRLSILFNSGFDSFSFPQF